MSEPTPLENLPPSPRKVYDAARALGLDIEVHIRTESTRTAEEAAAACGCSVAQIVKSLVFRGGASGKTLLFLVAGDNRLDEALAGALVDDGLERPDGRSVRETTGFAIGGIPPFGHAVPLETIMDEDLLAHDVVWAAAGAPNAVFPIAPHKLRAATRAQVARLAAAL
ncbi:MAG TPA: YbaK/EbsC family protein [Roseiarcus sp.]|nr:YbaK/EbsC family protein [Roseiarcus sp.]